MGIDEAREMAENIRKDKGMEVAVKVESSTAIAPVKPNLEIAGLEEVPVSMIPLPFYKLVQPGSTNTTMADGVDALPGKFLMGDSGKAVEQIRFALLRAKRMHRDFTNSEGEQVHSTSMGILGMNLENMTPFMLNVSVASFSNFGRMLSQMKDRGIKKAWAYPVTMTTEKREEVKETSKGVQKVKYWVINFLVEDALIEGIEAEALDQAYQEFAAALDRNIDEEAKTEEVRPF
jgi:hypothetical protein